jgi:hypothetical protein
VFRSLQRRGIRIWHGERVQRRVHVAGIDRQTSHALGGELFVPDRAHVPQRGFAGAVGAPGRIRVDRRVAGDIEHHGAATLARRRRQRAEDGFGQAEWTQQIRGERDFEIFAIGVGQESQRRRSKARGVVDQHVEAAELAEDLQGDRIDVVFPGHVADDAVGIRQLAGDALHRLCGTGDEGDVSAAAGQFADECKAES